MWRFLQEVADLVREEMALRVFANTQDPGDMIYLKMHTYCVEAFGLRGPLKLMPKYYDPFIVLQRIGWLIINFKKLT